MTRNSDYAIILIIYSEAIRQGYSNSIGSLKKGTKSILIIRIQIQIYISYMSTPIDMDLWY